MDALRTQITSAKSDTVTSDDTHTVPTEDTSTSAATSDTARTQRTVPPESDNTNKLPLENAATSVNARAHLNAPPATNDDARLPSESAQGPARPPRNPLFPNADPYYAQQRGTTSSRRVPHDKFPRLNAGRFPFSNNERQGADRSSFRDSDNHHDRSLPRDTHVRWQEDNDDSLGGMIVSPGMLIAADRRWLPGLVRWMWHDLEMFDIMAGSRDTLL